MDGERDVLSMWLQASEGAKFSMRPHWAQTAQSARHPHLLRRQAQGIPRRDRGDLRRDDSADRVVQLIRHSRKHVPRRQYRTVVEALKPISTAIDSDARAERSTRSRTRGGSSALNRPGWRRSREYVIPFPTSSPRSVA